MLSAAGSPCSTPCVVGRYEQSVRSTLVEAADQAATSSLEKKVEAEAAAKPSMRSPRVTHSTASTGADGACCKPAVEAWTRPHTLCIRHIRHISSCLRLRLHSLLAELHPRAPSWDPLAEKRGTISRVARSTVSDLWRHRDRRIAIDPAVMHA